jgi:putative ABC transport system permease protein
MKQTFAERLQEIRPHGSLALTLFLVREFISVAVTGCGQRLADLVRDVRFTLRTLAREPGFTVAAVATLALGIGANTAIFSVVNGVLLRPLPYHDPDRLVRLFELAPQGWHLGFSPPNLVSYRDQVSLLEGIAAYNRASLTITGDGDPERVPAMMVTAGLFELLGVPLLAGRTFMPGEDLAGAERVVILGHGMWQRRFQCTRQNQ